MQRPPLVISIQSQVVFGHVGNSAAVFPMQAVGLEVAAVPTVLFSNTPRYPTRRGRALPGDLFADLLLGVRERGLPERAAFVVTGYVGSAEVAEMVADFIVGAKAINPALVYLCDPVIGDSGPGLYVPEAVASVMRDRLLPMADIATPNQFELSWLSGRDGRTMADMGMARDRLSLKGDAHLIVTGCTLSDTPEGEIESLILGPQSVTRHATQRLPFALSGTGDLFSGLVVAGLGTGMTLAAAVESAQHLTAIAMQRAEAFGASEVMLNAPEFRHALLARYQPTAT